MYNIILTALHIHLSFSHEELNRLFGEVVEDVCMEGLGNDLCHEPCLTLNQPQKHGRGDDKCRTTLQLLIKHTPTAQARLN